MWAKLSLPGKASKLKRQNSETREIPGELQNAKIPKFPKLKNPQKLGSHFRFVAQLHDVESRLNKVPPAERKWTQRELRHCNVDNNSKIVAKEQLGYSYITGLLCTHDRFGARIIRLPVRTIPRGVPLSCLPNSAGGRVSQGALDSPICSVLSFLACFGMQIVQGLKIILYPAFFARKRLVVHSLKFKNL